MVGLAWTKALAESKLMLLSCMRLHTMYSNAYFTGVLPGSCILPSNLTHGSRNHARVMSGHSWTEL
jgi:hypothetical protein